MCLFLQSSAKQACTFSTRIGFANWFDLEGKKTIPLNYQRYSKSHRTAFCQSQSLNGFLVIAGFTLNIRLCIVFTKEKEIIVVILKDHVIRLFIKHFVCIITL